MACWFECLPCSLSPLTPFLCTPGTHSGIRQCLSSGSWPQTRCLQAQTPKTCTTACSSASAEGKSTFQGLQLLLAPVAGAASLCMGSSPSLGCPKVLTHHASHHPGCLHHHQKPKPQDGHPWPHCPNVPSPSTLLPPPRSFLKVPLKFRVHPTKSQWFFNLLPEHSSCSNPGPQIFPLSDQVIPILGFAGHIAFVATTKLSHSGAKAAIKDT